MSEPTGPITRSRGGFALRLAPEERTLVGRLLDEMRVLITDPSPSPAVGRLFPVTYPDDPEHEAEYQRLMRDDLVTSKVAGIDVVTDLFDRQGRTIRLDDGELLALMQALNGVRLVLGTMLDVGEDDIDGVDVDEEEEEDEDEAEESDVTPEHHLYGYLSWLLEACVQAIADDEAP